MLTCCALHGRKWHHRSGCRGCIAGRIVMMFWQQENSSRSNPVGSDAPPIEDGVLTTHDGRRVLPLRPSRATKYRSARLVRRLHQKLDCRPSTLNLKCVRRLTSWIAQAKPMRLAPTVHAPGARFRSAAGAITGPHLLIDGGGNAHLLLIKVLRLDRPPQRAQGAHLQARRAEVAGSALGSTSERGSSAAYGCRRPAAPRSAGRPSPLEP